jgi:signal transduction histidine kinase
VLVAVRTVLTGDAGPVGERTAAILRIAEKSVVRMARLIQDFLDLEKIEAGTIRMRLERLELAPLLEEAIEGQSRVSLEATPGLMVEGDRDRLMQVVVNLLSNALKFSPEDRPVEVRASHRDGRVRVSVTDHGPGVPDELRPRLFQRFARAAHPTERGSGLGLSISKALVEELGGKMGFESKPGAGATFYFELPEAARLAAGR